ncbi:hypothetical protein KI387_005527, partial [Taxus chinensis]
ATVVSTPSTRSPRYLFIWKAGFIYLTSAVFISGWWLDMAVRLITMRNENEQNPAVSPTAEILNTPSLDLCIHVVFEFDEPVDVNHAKNFIQETLLSTSTRFSSIVSKNGNGVLQWQKTEVNVEDHIFVPYISPDLISFDNYVEEYVSDMHLRKLSPSRPLWEFHFLNCKTRATVILNIHHMLGDGVSLMALGMACSTRSKNPTIPPSLPLSSHCKQRPAGKTHEKSHKGWLGFKFLWHLLFSVVVVMWHTLNDLFSSFVRVKWMEDSRFSFRGHAGVELLPKVMASTTFNLHDIREIKNRVEGSVNDVMMGVVFYGFRLYCNMVFLDPKQADNLRVTALGLINTRSEPGIKSLKEMTESKTGDSWGNRFSFLQLPVPMKKLNNPLEYVTRAKYMMDQKKMSVASFLINRVMNFITRFRGAQVSGKAMYDLLANTTVTVSNMQGPKEEMTFAGYAIKSGFFSVSGVPQSILVTCPSYNECVRMQGFRKMDPNRWELSHGSFLREQKHLLSNIRRRRRSPHKVIAGTSCDGLCIKYESEGELEKLKKEDTIIRKVVELKEQQKDIDREIHDMKRQLQAIED